MIDPEIEKIIEKAEHQYAGDLVQHAIQEAAKRFAEIADTEGDRNEGSAANAILIAAGIEP